MYECAKIWYKNMDRSPFRFVLSLSASESSDLMALYELVFSLTLTIHAPLIVHFNRWCLDVFDRKCCQVDCYTLVDCKLAYSEQCTSAPVECASGKS